MNRRPSTKVTASSAIAGTVTALLYGIQQAEAIPDLPTWVVFLLAIAASSLATFAAGYPDPRDQPGTVGDPDGPHPRGLLTRELSAC